MPSRPAIFTGFLNSLGQCQPYEVITVEKNNVSFVVDRQNEINMETGRRQKQSCVDLLFLINYLVHEFKKNENFDTVSKFELWRLASFVFRGIDDAAAQETLLF